MICRNSLSFRSLSSSIRQIFIIVEVLEQFNKYARWFKFTNDVVVVSMDSV